MNKYETVIIVNDTLSEEEKLSVIDKIVNLIEQNGNFESKEILGSKKLAYEIKKQSTGYYCVIYFESNSEFIYELERVYRITDEILKFIVVKKDE